MPHSITCTLSTPNVLQTSLYGNFFHNHLWLTTHFMLPRAQITKTKHQNIPLNIFFSLLNTNNVKKIWNFFKNPLKKSVFSLLSNFWLQTPMVCIYGTGKFFQYLRHYLLPIPSTFTRIEILILCTILLCSVQHILIQKIKKLYFDFWPTKNQQWR